MTQNLDPLEIVNRPSTGQQQATGNNMLLTLEQARLSGNPFSVGDDFVQSDLSQRELTRELQAPIFGVGEDLEVQQARGGTPRFVETDLGGMFRSNIESGGEADLRQLLDQGTANRLEGIGLQGRYEQDEYRGYNYNPETGQYDYYDYTPSLIEQAAPALIKAGLITAATAGLGGAISAATGLGTGASTGLATGTMTLAQGGDVKDAVINGLTAGIGAEIKTLNSAIKAGTATNEMIATAEILNDVKNVANLAQAVDSGNVIQGIVSGVDLAGLGSVKNVVGQGVNAVAGDSEFFTNNSDAITEGVVSVFEEGIKGTDPAMIVAKGLWEYGKNGGELPNLDFDFGKGNWDTPEWLKAIDDEALQPIKDAIKAGYDELNDKVLNPIQETADGIIRDLPTSKEDWEKAEDFIKEDVAPAVRDVGRFVRDLMPDVNLPSFPDLPSFSGAGFAGNVSAPQQYVPRKEFKPERTELVESLDLLRNSDFANPLLRG
jgi:hypothetical protein